MITKATSPGYLYAVTTDSTCIITDVDTRYNLCKAVVNKQGMFAAIGGSVECSDDNAVLTQASTVSGGTRFEVVATRPEIGETGVIYLVPASNSTTENLYEEWVWVDDKWEQIGSAGLNLSNYAQLTTANTFSNANTFNGNLIKKTSGSLADNSVLNRSEMDSRYGRLLTSNEWKGSNEFNTIKTTGMISLNSNNTVYMVGGNNNMSLKATYIDLHGHVTIAANKSLRVPLLSTDTISGINSLKLEADTSIINIADTEVSIYGHTGINLDSSGDISIATDERLRLTGMTSLSLGCKNANIWLEDDITNEGSIHLVAGMNAAISMSHKAAEITLDATTINLGASAVNMADDGMLRFTEQSHITKTAISGVPVLDNDARKINLGSQRARIPGTNNYCVDITPGLFTPYIHADWMAVRTISGLQTLQVKELLIHGDVSIVGSLGVAGYLSAGFDKDNIDVVDNLHMQGNYIKAVSSISSPSGVNLGIKSNIHAYGHNINEVNELKLGKLKASTLSDIPNRIDVLSSLHFATGSNSYVDPDIVIANKELLAVDLSMVLGKENKYGLRITDTSCQLFGIDFMFGDVWSAVSDAYKAQGITMAYPLQSPSSLDMVKINKPGVTISSDDKAYLGFDYANEVYIRSFPNDGGQALFEFQGGHWTDDNHNNIKLGAVDIRKMSAETLHPTSLLNMAEGDARWGSGGSDYMKVTTDMRDDRGVSIGDGLYPGTGVGIGAQVDLTDSDVIAIGARINAQSKGRPHKVTMLGYQLATAGDTATRMIALGGYAKTTGYLHVCNGAISIGYVDSTVTVPEGAVVIGNNAMANNSDTVAIGLEAVASGVHSLALGLASYADDIYGVALGGQALASGHRTIAIGGQTNAYGDAALCIGNEARIGTDGARADGGMALGPVANCASMQAVAVGGWSTIGTNATGATALGYTARVYKNSSNGIAVGCNAAVVGDKSIAIGANAEALHGSIVIGANGKATFPGIFISNIGNDDSSSNSLGNGSIMDTGICLSAAAVGWTANSIIFELSSNSTRSVDAAVTFRSIDDKYEADTYGHCSREAFASILNNARLRNYPAQPFVSLVGDDSEVPPALAKAQPNTIYHIITGSLDIDLTNMMFDSSIPGIASAELHFEVPNGTTPVVVWPDIMIWPDEADPTVAPTLSSSASGNKLYAIVVRKQITRAGEFLVASIAYSFEY